MTILSRSSLALLSCALLAGCSAEAQLKDELAEANYCETANDCVLIGSKCPFDCYVYVNSAEADAMKTKLDAYQSTCEYSCIATRGVECTANKCVPIVDAPAQ